MDAEGGRRQVGDMRSEDAAWSVYCGSAAHIIGLCRGYAQRGCHMERALVVGCAYHGGRAGMVMSPEDDALVM